jgi:regulator of protease activity HflC (stomatin/prohibitin superfamily)
VTAVHDRCGSAPSRSRASQRQATITVAEGDKQSQILQAEGERQSPILKAQGYGQALETVYAAAQQVDGKTMTLQVIDGLKALGASPGSTFVIPMEFTRLFGQIGQYLDQSLGSTAGLNRQPSENGEVATKAPGWTP